MGFDGREHKPFFKKELDDFIAHVEGVMTNKKGLYSCFLAFFLVETSERGEREIKLDRLDSIIIIIIFRQQNFVVC